MHHFLKKYFGPSTIIAAAFIGPGTVTVCSLAGIKAGYSLLWALLFSLVATMILQEMAGRLGLITQKGLGENLMQISRSKMIRGTIAIMIFVAIVIGNAAYQAGNISGAVLGLEAVLPEMSFSLLGFKLKAWALVIAAIAFILLWTGSYKLLERSLIALVGLMSLVFVVSMLWVKPDFWQIMKGFFVPQVANQDLLLVLALIGTTVVPYNLFLHAASVGQKWKAAADLRGLRVETMVAVMLGGLVSASIIILSAATLGQKGGEVKGIKELAMQLEPLMGAWSSFFLGIGMMAAGLTSAITAPLAAALAMQGVWKNAESFKSFHFRLIWMIVLFTGATFAASGHNPLQLIQIAQVANAILLPIVVVMLLVMMNKSAILKDACNSKIQNLLGVFVLLICLLISARLFWVVLG